MDKGPLNGLLAKLGASQLPGLWLRRCCDRWLSLGLLLSYPAQRLSHTPTLPHSASAELGATLC